MMASCSVRAAGKNEHFLVVAAKHGYRGLMGGCRAAASCSSVSNVPEGAKMVLKTQGSHQVQIKKKATGGEFKS